MNKKTTKELVMELIEVEQQLESTEDVEQHKHLGFDTFQ